MTISNINLYHRHTQTICHYPTKKETIMLDALLAIIAALKAIEDAINNK